MGIVAACTRHQAFANRMMGSPLDRRLDFHVTAVACLGDGCSLQLKLKGFRMVNRVARYAGKSALLMNTSFQMDLHSVFMAGQANDGGFSRLHLAGIMDQGRIAAA